MSIFILKIFLYCTSTLAVIATLIFQTFKLTKEKLDIIITRTYNNQNARCPFASWESTTRQSSPIHLRHLKIIKMSYHICHFPFSRTVTAPTFSLSVVTLLLPKPSSPLLLISVFNLQIKPRPQSNSLLQPSLNIFTSLLQQKQ